MARIAVEDGQDGAELEMGKPDAHMKRLPARSVALPFLDPDRERPAPRRPRATAAEVA